MIASCTSRTALGAGLLALDLILKDEEVIPARDNVVAGGSCGNVLAVLAYLGWDAYPVAQLGDNAATTILCQDLLRWGVKTDFIDKSAQGVTPLIIHRIYRAGGRHKFEFRNPQTRQWLPRFRPFTKKYGQLVSPGFPEAAVFYFDRASPANLVLAEQHRHAGALVVFEPSTDKDKGIFERALAVAHIVKFSEQRLPGYSDAYPANQVPIEIQTQGEAGIRYRTQATGPAWMLMPALHLTKVVDTAGAGDWCTAGIIDQLLTQPTDCTTWLAPERLAHAISVGQTYGTINCCFAGARGAMYHLSSAKFKQAAAQLQQEGDTAILSEMSKLPIQPANRPSAVTASPLIDFHELLHN